MSHGTPPIKISVVTPLFNRDDALRQAIESVERQGVAFTEHIVVDARPPDGGRDLLDDYPHLILRRTRHADLADALRIGLRRASGEIVVWLNADERFADGAFAAVLPRFELGAQAVMGNVRVDAGEADGVWINSAPGDFAHLMRHWEHNAFCLSPAALFVRRRVLNQWPPDLLDGQWIDLDGQLQLACHGAVEKVETVLAEIDDPPDSPRRRARAIPSFWREARFPFLQKYLMKLPEHERADYQRRQRHGYQARRHFAILESMRNGTLDDLVAIGEVVPLAQGWHDAFCAAGDTVAAICGVDDALPLRQALRRALASHVWVPVLTFGAGLDLRDPAFLPDMDGRAHHAIDADPVLALYRLTVKKLRWHFFAAWDDTLQATDRLVFQKACGLLTGSPDLPFFLKPDEPFTLLEGVSARLCLYRKEALVRSADIILKQFLDIPT